MISCTERICNWKDCNTVIPTPDKRVKFCCDNHNKLHKRSVYEQKKDDNRKPKLQHVCENCNTQFESYKSKVRACSRKCIEDIKNKEIRELRRIENHKKYKDVENIPTCTLCGWKSRSLQNHLTTHNLTVDQYKEQYNIKSDGIFHESFNQMKSDRMIGENNPGYQHGGTRSSFSLKYNQYDGLSDHQKEERVKAQIIKANATKKYNDSYTTTKQYYTKKGFTEIEAKRLVSQRQTTFSLAICITKHGNVLGRRIWEERQRKWLESMKHVLGCGYSKISQQLFDSICENFDLPCFYATNGTNAGFVNNEYLLKLETRYVKPDFYVPGLQCIIEFDGDYWHSDLNPNNICSITRDTRIMQKYPDMKIYHVYERDYRTTPTGVVEKCLQFLKS